MGATIRFAEKSDEADIRKLTQDSTLISTDSLVFDVDDVGICGVIGTKVIDRHGIVSMTMAESVDDVWRKELLRLYLSLDQQQRVDTLFAASSSWSYKLLINRGFRPINRSNLPSSLIELLGSESIVVKEYLNRGR